MSAVAVPVTDSASVVLANENAANMAGAKNSFAQRKSQLEVISIAP